MEWFALSASHKDAATAGLFYGGTLHCWCNVLSTAHCPARDVGNKIDDMEWANYTIRNYNAGVV